MASSCGQPCAHDRADESSDGREADYPVETLELRAEIEPGRRIREPLPGHTSHDAPERHSGQTEEQGEHASAPYELDRPNHKSHRRCPQRVVVQLHKSTLSERSRSKAVSKQANCRSRKPRDGYEAMDEHRAIEVLLL